MGGHSATSLRQCLYQSPTMRRGLVARDAGGNLHLSHTYHSQIFTWKGLVRTASPHHQHSPPLTEIQDFFAYQAESMNPRTLDLRLSLAQKQEDTGPFAGFQIIRLGHGRLPDTMAGRNPRQLK